MKHWSISLMISTCSVPLAFLVFKHTLRIRCTLKDVLRSNGLHGDSVAWELGVTQSQVVYCLQWFRVMTVNMEGLVVSPGQEKEMHWVGWMGQQELCFRVGWLGGWRETLLVIEEETEVKSLLRPSWYLSQESCLNGSAVKYTPLQQKKNRLRGISGHQKLPSQARMIFCLMAVRKRPSHRSSRGL